MGPRLIVVVRPLNFTLLVFGESLASFLTANEWSPCCVAYVQPACKTPGLQTLQRHHPESDTNGYFSQHENGAQQPSFIHFGSCKGDSTALPHETQSAFDCPPLLSMITFSLNSICAISLSFAFQQTQHQKEYEGRTCQCDADRLSKQSTAKELTRYPSSGHQDGDSRPCKGFSV